MPSNTTLFCIYGCGGHAKSVADVCLKIDSSRKLLFIDEGAKCEEKILGFSALVALPHGLCYSFVAVGNNRKRRAFWESLDNPFALQSILSPLASISRFASIGANVFIGPFAHIGPEAVIGENTIVNTGAIVEHEVQIGSHSHIGPNASISGRCSIGSEVFIGVGATVKDSIRIGSHIVVGAGAVVVQDLLEPGTYIGCPAKKMIQQVPQ